MRITPQIMHNTDTPSHRWERRWIFPTFRRSVFSPPQKSPGAVRRSLNDAWSRGPPTNECSTLYTYSAAQHGVLLRSLNRGSDLTGFPPLMFAIGIRILIMGIKVKIHEYLPRWSKLADITKAISLVVFMRAGQIFCPHCAKIRGCLRLFFCLKNPA